MSRVLVEIERKLSFSCFIVRAARLLEQSVFCTIVMPTGSQRAPGWAQQPAVTQLLGQYCLWRHYQLFACEALFDVWHLLAALLYSVICALYFHVFACAVSQCHGYGGGSGEPQSCFIPYLHKNIWAGSLLWKLCLEWLGSNLNLKKRPSLMLFVQSLLWSCFKCKGVKFSTHQIQW